MERSTLALSRQASRGCPRKQDWPLIFICVTVVNFALLKSAVGYEDDTSNSNSQLARLNLDSEIIVSLSKELGLTPWSCIRHGS